MEIPIKSTTRGRKISHGQSYTKLYHVWGTMKSRCKNPNDNGYKDYGSRGIVICDEWETYENFYKWATSNGYKKGLELDRKNNDGNYEPGNCRWATREQQNNNKRTTRFIVVSGIILNLSQWAKSFNISPATINSYVKLHNISYESYVKLRIEGRINTRGKK